jgi:phosphoenolpyruvate carboxylase
MPLQHLQVALIERLPGGCRPSQQPDPAVARALLVTITGIASRMGNPG